MAESTRLQFNSAQLRRIFDRLFDAYGPQHWWPGDSPFEVMVGAVLTQNTAWGNVEKAIANLIAAGALSPDAILALPESALAELLRPSGYFNVKARRLRNFCRFLVDRGGEVELARLATTHLRHDLLSVNGVGPETADDILLYAFARPVFVIDAYTKRLLRRLSLVRGDEGYEALRLAFEQTLGPDVALFNEYHALIVRHAKNHCRARRPGCEGCPLMAICERNIQ